MVFHAFGLSIEVSWCHDKEDNCEVWNQIVECEGNALWVGALSLQFEDKTLQIDHDKASSERSLSINRLITLFEDHLIQFGCLRRAMAEHFVSIWLYALNSMSGFETRLHPLLRPFDSSMLLTLCALAVSCSSSSSLTLLPAVDPFPPARSA